MILVCSISLRFLVATLWLLYHLHVFVIWCMCKYPNVQFTITGNGTPISSNGTHYRYCPFFDPT